MKHIIETERLHLRKWRTEDLPFFIEMNKDPKVMEYFPATLTKEESTAFLQRIQDHFKEHDFGLLACELKETGELIGYVGLAIPPFQAHFTPCVEIGWRLRTEFWGKGYATEAAKAVLAYGFNELHLPEIVSFTVPANVKSRRVMEKLGMHFDERDDFQHPRLPVDHALSKHVLYRLKKR